MAKSKEEAELLDASLRLKALVLLVNSEGYKLLAANLEKKAEAAQQLAMNDAEGQDRKKGRVTHKVLSDVLSFAPKQIAELTKEVEERDRKAR